MKLRQISLNLAPKRILKILIFSLIKTVQYLLIEKSAIGEGVGVAAEVTGGRDGVEVAEAACEGREEAAGAAVLSVLALHND